MKVYKWCFAALFCCLLTGCRGQENSEETVTSVSDWKNRGFALSGELTEEQGFWVESHISWNHDSVCWDTETEGIIPAVIEAGISGHKVYRFYPVAQLPQVSSVRGILECYDTSTMEVTVTELNREQMGLDVMEDGIIVDMDIPREGSFVFQTVEYGGDENGHIVQRHNGMVYSDLQGNAEFTDLQEIYREKGIAEERDNSIILAGECICDAAGNSYVRSGEKLFVLDREGNLLMEYSVSEQEQILEPARTESGELIFLVCGVDEKISRFIWLDVESGNVRVLATLEEWVMKLYGMQGNDIYYESSEGIVRWDVASGIRNLCFRFDENGVSGSFNKMLVFREEQPPVLRAYGVVNDMEEDWLLVLSEEPVEQQEAVRIVSLAGTSVRVKDCAGIAGRRNPDYFYSYEDSTEKNSADLRNQVMAEMIGGGGPDILYVSREDMELMQEKGLLADLRSLISEETLNEVLPGVIELGSVQGVLAGIAPEISAVSVLVGEDVWSGDGWTLEDMLELMENGRLQGRLIDGSTCHSSKISLWVLLRYCLEDSFLIDWEKGESHFDDERFIRLLEYAGRSDTEAAEDVREGGTDGEKSWMILIGLKGNNDVPGFLGTKDAPGTHYVGFPSGQGNGNYLETAGVVVVNKNLSNPSAVTAWLECLLGKEVQDIGSIGVGLSVMPFSPEEIRSANETEGARWRGMEIEVFEDGTTALDEVNTFLGRCVPMPVEHTEIEKIIQEETAGYFDGSRTAEDVAQTIDNRVQLYLDVTVQP